jgi:glycosyltransferase involved in cell wall biosynthesis
MKVGYGVSVSSADRALGRSSGITTYTDCLLHALRTEYPQHQFTEARFEPDREITRKPLQTHFGGGLISMVTGYRFSPKTVFGIEVDIFHAPDHKIPALTVPVVASIHDASSVSMRRLALSRMPRLRARTFTAKAQFAELVITGSYYAAEEISTHLHLDRRRVHVIYDGVAEHILAEAARELDWAGLMERYGLRPGYVAYCGAIAIKKNLVGLIDAFAALPERLRKAHPLVMIGAESQYGDGRETVDRIRAAEKEGYVRWLGALPDEDMARVVHHALAFAFPSFHEGFGLPVAEAFHLGVPVVTSNVTALPEIAGDAALLIDPHDLRALTGALETLLTDDSVRADLSRKGKIQSKKFSWTQCCRETFDVYELALRGA